MHIGAGKDLRSYKDFTRREKRKGLAQGAGRGVLPHRPPALPAVGPCLYVQPTASALALHEHHVNVFVLFQYVKEHSCVFLVVDVYVGSESPQVVGIRYASHPGVQFLRPVSAVDVDGLADCIAQGLQHVDAEVLQILNHLHRGRVLQLPVACGHQFCQTKVWRQLKPTPCPSRGEWGLITIAICIVVVRIHKVSLQICCSTKSIQTPLPSGGVGGGFCYTIVDR